MRHSTAYNHMTRLERRLRDIYSSARMFGLTHEALLADVTAKVYNDAAWRRLPGWAQGHIHVIGSELSSALFRPHLHAAEFERMLSDARNGKPVIPAAYLRYAHRLDGVGVTVDEVCRLANDAENREGPDARIAVWHRLEGTHIWNHKGMSHPFSPWESDNSRAKKKVTANG